jgi:hypothetical protein
LPLLLISISKQKTFVLRFHDHLFYTKWPDIEKKHRGHIVLYKAPPTGRNLTSIAARKYAKEFFKRLVLLIRVLATNSKILMNKMIAINFFSIQIITNSSLVLKPVLHFVHT